MSLERKPGEARTIKPSIKLGPAIERHTRGIFGRRIKTYPTLITYLKEKGQ